MLDPHSIEAVQGVSRFFFETANSLGEISRTSLHAEYTDISATMDTTPTRFTTRISSILDGMDGSVVGISGSNPDWVFRMARRGLPSP